MKKRVYKTVKGLLLAAVFAACFLFGAVSVKADPTDEILNFTITVDVNADASLSMNYYIEWKVLDDSIGALEWIDLGVPNRYHTQITPVSDTIDHIEDNGNSLAIYLDRSYYEDEIAAVEFSMIQDHMYQIDKFVEGETVYTFTPAWFDGMDIDELVIRWNDENAGAWQPDCLMEDGYLVFRTSVSAGNTYTMTVVYPNEAFGFSVDRQADGGGDDYDYNGNGNNNYNGGSSASDVFEMILGLLVFLGIMAIPIMLVVRFIRWISGGLGFGGGSSAPAAKEKKIIRTKIDYYDTCPGCGAGREEGKDNCPFCGHSMIKHKEIVEENQIEKPEKYTKDGTYRYGDSPNSYIHVDVLYVPVSHSHSGGSRHHYSGSSHTRSRSSGSSSSHRSSCASSCACASTCACVSSCACACACASSGRAGCTVKDFFRASKRIFVRSYRPEEE